MLEQTLHDQTETTLDNPGRRLPLPTAEMTSTPTLTLTPTAEIMALSYASTHKPLAMVSLVAPALTVDRLPVDVVAMVDCSGSMHGDKMEQMKMTMRLLVQSLACSDKLSIVAFDSDVTTPLALTAQNASGKEAALSAVSKLSAGSLTNLSGGLLRGLDELLSMDSEASARTRALLLLTDGHANVGVQDPAGILAAIQGVTQGRSITLFTFGIGCDHNEDLLRALAEPNNGLFYFIQKSDDIPSAFADCLGGLVSVVAQNAKLTLEPVAAAAALSKVHGSYRIDHTKEGRAEVYLGDVYGEDNKDVLLTLELPERTSVVIADEPDAVVLRATLRYFSVPTCQMEEISAELSILRPEVTPTDQPVDLKLDEQVNRIKIADAMEAATAAADEGRLEAGRELLTEASALVSASPSHSSPFTKALISDVKRVLNGFTDGDTYHNYGARLGKGGASSHYQQRSTHDIGGSYRGSGKGGMGLEFRRQALASEPKRQRFADDLSINMNW